MVDNIHIHYVVLSHDVPSIRVILLILILFTSPYFNIAVNVSAFELTAMAELEYHIKDARSYIKIAQIANQILELGLFAHFETILSHMRKGLELFNELSNCLKGHL